MEEIHNGWLTKSPGSKKVKIFSTVPTRIKAKWQRRFFRLYRPKGALPNQYELTYYKDETLRNEKGSINLVDCEKIQASLDSTYYKYLFCIETSTKRNENRTYFLASDEEEEMIKWVEVLCRICNLSTEHRADGGENQSQGEFDNDYDNAVPEEPRQSDLSLMADEEAANQILDDIDRQKKNIEKISNGQSPGRPPPRRPAEGYTELSQCTTGLGYVSDVLITPVMAANGDEIECTYAVSNSSPPKPNTPQPPQPCHSSLPSSPVHRTHQAHGAGSHITTAPIPTPRNKLSILHNMETSREDLESSTSSVSSRQNKTMSHTSQSSTYSNDGQETYECMSPTSPVSSQSRSITARQDAPPRPPKQDQQQEEDYVNIASNDEERRRIDSLYDIPKSWTGVAPPPPCEGLTGKIHKYQNAATCVVTEGGGENDYPAQGDQNLVDLASSLGQVDLNKPVKPTGTKQSITRPGYLPMQTQLQEYTAMSPTAANDYNDGDDDVYDIAPPSRPVGREEEYTHNDDVYDIAPPTRPILTHQRESSASRPESDIYDIAPPTRPLNRSKLTSEPVNTRPDSDIYDVAPPTRPVESHSRPDSDVYDIVPPSRPLNSNSRPDSDIYDVAPLSRPVQMGRPNSRPVSDDVYDIAPPTRPVASINAPIRPPKPRQFKESDSGAMTASDISSSSAEIRISQTTRTKSYIRDSVFSDSESFDMPDHVKQHISGGVGAEIRLPERRADNSSSEEEDEPSDEDEGGDNIYDVPPPRPQVLSPTAQPSPAVRTSLATKPVAPARIQKPARPAKPAVLTDSGVSKEITTSKVEYVELTHNNNEDDDEEYATNPRKHSSTSSNNIIGGDSTTEYTDINLMKTQALSATRKERTLTNSIKR